MSMWANTKEWLEVRLGLGDYIKANYRDYKIPANTHIFQSLGLVAMAAFVIQVLTGIVLLLYYIPDANYETKVTVAQHSFISVQYIMNEVSFGWLFRLMHVVGSNLLVAVIFLHLAAVFVMGSYQKPRELTWVSGAIMLFLALGFAMTGYLLTWSHNNYWATTIVSSISRSLPLVGEYLTDLVRGGDRVTDITLHRYFALHIALIPAAFIGLLGLHVFFVRRVGISSLRFGENVPKLLPWDKFSPREHENGMPFYPNYFVKQVFLIFLYVTVMFYFITFMPKLFLPDLAHVVADVTRTPAYVRPQWFFLAPYQMLKLFPNELVGITIQAVLAVVFIGWPFFEKGEERNILKRPLLLGVFLLTVSLWIVLTIWGTY